MSAERPAVSCQLVALLQQDAGLRRNAEPARGRLWVVVVLLSLKINQYVFVSANNILLKVALSYTYHISVIG